MTIRSLIVGGGGGVMTATAMARALLATGKTDAQIRAAIGGAASLTAGLTAVLSPAPTPAPTPTPTPTPTPVIGTVLSGFETPGQWAGVGSYAFSQDTSPAFQGSSALRVDFLAGGSGATAVQRTFAATDPANLGPVAFCTQLDTDYDWQTDASVTVSILLNGGGTVYPIASRTGLVTATPKQATKTGLVWTSGRVTQQVVLDAATGSHAFRLATGAFATGPQCGSRAHDVIVIKVGGKAGLLLRFDDAIVDAATIALPIMGPLGIVGQCFPPTNQVGATEKLSWAQLKQLEDAGWAIGVNGDPDDLVMTSSGSVAGAVARLTAQRDELVSRGLKTTNAFVYPFGYTRENGTRIEKTSADLAGNAITPTDGSTAGIVVGMRVVATGLSRTVRVQSVTATTVTLTENVVTAATGKRCSFVDDSPAFHGNKLQSAARVAGWKWGISTDNGDFFCQYGISPDDAIVMPSTSTTGMTLATFQAAVNSAIANKSVLALTIHRIRPAGASGSSIWTTESFTDCMTWLKTQMDAGLIEPVTTALLDQKYGNARPPA